MNIGTTSPVSLIGDVPVLSFVVIGRNEGERLVRCLESISQIQPLKGSVEVIYVDSGSTDDSVEHARQLNARVITLQSAYPCAAAGRNVGWRASKAPIVFFLDGDTVLDPIFLVASIEEFNDPTVAVVFGNRREIYPAASIYNRVLDLDWITSPGSADSCGGDALIRREVLERIGGYDEQLIAGEEPEMCRRIRALGFTILHVDLPMTGHDLAIMRLSQYWRRAMRTGYAYAELAARFRSTALPLWQKEARRSLLHGGALLALTVGAVIGSISFHSTVPLVATAILLILVAARTAVRFSWKTPDALTLILFGFHSHLVKIPLFFGRLLYEFDRLSGHKTGLIEYKDCPGFQTGPTLPQ